MTSPSSPATPLFSKESPDDEFANILYGHDGSLHYLWRAVPEGVLRLHVPVMLINPKAWHDVLVRFRGANLELFVDGVLVDEEWPHVLTLRTTPDGPRLFFEPAKELGKLRTGVSAQMPKTTLDGTTMLLKKDKPLGELVELGAVFTVKKDVMAQSGDNIVGLDINGQTVTCNLDNEQMIGNDGYQPLKVIDGQIKLRVFVDRTVVESFAAGVSWAPLAYPFVPADHPTYAVKVFGKKGLADVELIAYQLQSITCDCLLMNGWLRFISMMNF